MPDLKRITDKIRRPLFWKRTSPTESKETSVAGQPLTSKPPRKWYTPTFLKIAPVFLVALLFIPKAAQGQFGIDLAAILAAISKVESLMSTYVAAPLKTINQAQQSIGSYEQQIVYPITAINQAKNSVTQFENQFTQIGSMFRVNVFKRHTPAIAEFGVPAPLS